MSLYTNTFLYVPHFIALRLRKAPQKAFTHIVHRIGIVSVALGLSTTLIAFLIMEGFQKRVSQRLNMLNGHLQVTKYSLNRSYEDPPLDVQKVELLQQQFPEFIQVSQAFAHKSLLLKAKEEVEGVVCKGLDPRVTHKNLVASLAGGRLLDFPSQGYSREIILSTQTANKLNIRVGDQVIAYVVQQPPLCRKLHVVGLYKTHIAEVDEKLAFCDLRLIQRLNGWPENLVGGYEFFVREPRQITTTVERLLAYLDYNLKLTTTADLYAAIFDWLTLVRKNALIFMVLILLVASTNIASIVLIQTMERTTMIGTLRTLGASNGMIRHAVLLGYLHMVGLGMFWGNLMGLGLCYLQYWGQLVSLDPAYYYIDHVPIAWNWDMILGLNALTIAVVVFVLVISLVAIVRISPVRAVRIV